MHDISDSCFFSLEIIERGSKTCKDFLRCKLKVVMKYDLRLFIFFIMLSDCKMGHFQKLVI